MQSSHSINREMLAITLFVLLPSYSLATDNWLQMKLEAMLGGADSDIVCFIRISNEDRAIVLARRSGNQEIFLLFKGSGTNVQVAQIRNLSATPTPMISALLLESINSKTSLPFPNRRIAAVDQSVTSGSSASPVLLRLVKAIDFISVLTEELFIYNDGLIALQGKSPGNIASKCGLHKATVYFTGHDYSMSSSRDVSHINAASLVNSPSIMTGLKSIPSSHNILSIGTDDSTGLLRFSTKTHVSLQKVDGSWIVGKEFVPDDQIIMRYTITRAKASALQIEHEFGLLNDLEIMSLKALSCHGFRVTMLQWNRHPRFYSQVR